LIERWDATRGATDPRRFFWLGIIGGAAMTMRAQEVFFLLLPAGEIVFGLLRSPERGVRRAWLLGGVRLTLGALIGFAPQLLVWYYYTHTLHPPQVDPIRWREPMWMVALFSTRSGLFP